MIFFVEAFEVLFVLYAAVRGIAYGIYNIKDKNTSGGVIVFALIGIMLFLLILNLYKSV